MSKLKQLNEEYTTVHGIRDLVSTYQEIASLRMRSVRDYVLQNRDYFTGLSKIYGLVMNTYQNEIESLAKSNKRLFRSDKGPFRLRRNGETLYVFLSSNTALYGSIVQETFNTFLEAAQQTPSAKLAVIGKTGKLMMDNSRLGREYTYFELADSLNDSDNIKKIQEFLLAFEQVVVFHGVFESILDQKPTQSFITGGSSEKLAANKNVHFMFEPNLQEVLNYFENQIVASSFLQALNESYLSKYASRMVSLDNALTGIDKNLRKINLNKQKQKHTVANRKQQDIIAGRSLWKI